MLKTLAVICLQVFSSLCHAGVPSDLKPAAELLSRITHSKVRPYSTRDFGRDKYSGAISALVPESKAESMHAEVRRQLPSGMVAFIGTTQNLAETRAEGVEIVVGPGSSPLDIIEIAATDAVNYDMDTAQLKAKLAEWHQKYGIDIWHAETDTIELRFIKMPENAGKFAGEVYEFCPDIVDQGAGTVEALGKLIEEQKGLFLWWD